MDGFVFWSRVSSALAERGCHKEIKTGKECFLTFLDCFWSLGFLSFYLFISFSEGQGECPTSLGLNGRPEPRVITSDLRVSVQQGK